MYYIYGQRLNKAGLPTTPKYIDHTESAENAQDILNDIAPLFDGAWAQDAPFNQGRVVMLPDGEECKSYA